MTTAQVHSFQLDPEESLHSLQKRIEAETRIEVVNQELLQETGVSLDPRKPAAQCVLDGVVRRLSMQPRLLSSCIYIRAHLRSTNVLTALELKPSSGGVLVVLWSKTPTMSCERPQKECCHISLVPSFPHCFIVLNEAFFNVGPSHWNLL